MVGRFVVAEFGQDHNRRQKSDWDWIVRRDAVDSKVVTGRAERRVA